MLASGSGGELSHSVPLRPWTGPLAGDARRGRDDCDTGAKLRVKRRISEGAESEVFACVVRGTPVALKVFKSESAMCKEMDILRATRATRLFPEVRLPQRG